MDGFQKFLALAAVGLVVVIVVAFVWPGILYYAALALAILFFPLIVAMCGGYGVTGPDDDEQQQHG
jgi:fatty acid desaturase